MLEVHNESYGRAQALKLLGLKRSSCELSVKKLCEERQIKNTIYKIAKYQAPNSAWERYTKRGPQNAVSL